MAGAQGRVRGRHARRRWKFSPRSAVRGARGRVFEARGAARAVARARRAAGVQAHGGTLGERRGRWEISEEAAEGRRRRCGRASSERRRDAREGVRCPRNAARAPAPRQAGRDAVPAPRPRRSPRLCDALGTESSGGGDGGGGETAGDDVEGASREHALLVARSCVRLLRARSDPRRRAAARASRPRPSATKTTAVSSAPPTRPRAPASSRTGIAPARCACSDTPTPRFDGRYRRRWSARWASPPRRSPRSGPRTRRTPRRRTPSTRVGKRSPPPSRLKRRAPT